MYLIQGITSDARQKHSIIHPDTGLDIEITLEYSPMQYSWFAKVVYEDFTLNGIRVFTSPNIMRQFSNFVPFGIVCSVDGGQEPTLQEDFSSGRAKLYVLDREEVLALEDLFNG